MFGHGDFSCPKPQNSLLHALPAAGKKEKSTITLRIQWIPYQELSR